MDHSVFVFYLYQIISNQIKAIQISKPQSRSEVVSVMHVHDLWAAGEFQTQSLHPHRLHLLVAELNPSKCFTRSSPSLLILNQMEQ